MGFRGAQAARSAAEVAQHFSPRRISRPSACGLQQPFLERQLILVYTYGPKWELGCEAVERLDLAQQRL
jgi:hypothetical protein